MGLQRGCNVSLFGFIGVGGVRCEVHQNLDICDPSSMDANTILVLCDVGSDWRDIDGGLLGRWSFSSEAFDTLLPAIQTSHTVDVKAADTHHSPSAQKNRPSASKLRRHSSLAKSL
jgi:hypothetical protein